MCISAYISPIFILYSYIFDFIKILACVNFLVLLKAACNVTCLSEDNNMLVLTIFCYVLVSMIEMNNLLIILCTHIYIYRWYAESALIII